MNRLIVIGVLIALQSTLLIFSSNAQVKIGYLSYSEALQSMPEYRMAQEGLSELRAQYDNETRIAEEEFNAKYEDFLDNLTTLAASIRRKRQIELQQLMESNIRFREEASRLFKQAEEEALKPVRDTLNEKLAKIAQENGYIIILNSDGDALPYINSEWGDDVTELVKNALK